MSRTVEVWATGSGSGSDSESGSLESMDLDGLFEPANDVVLENEGDNNNNNNNSDGVDTTTSVDEVRKTVKKEDEDSAESDVVECSPTPPSPTPSPRESLKRRTKSSPSVASSCGAEEERRKVNETLSCSGCGFVSVPPIMSCPKGHLVCAICVDQGNGEGGGVGNGKCPSTECLESASNKLRKPILTPCPFAEALLRKNATEPMACRNLEKLGCRVKLPLWEMKEHLKKCRQRTVKCFVTQPENCGGRLFSEEKFLEHLMIFHESKDLRFNTSTLNNPMFTHAFEATQADLYGSGKETINVDHVRYKKGVFFLHGVKEGRCMYWWLTLLGPEEEALKYQYSFRVWVSTGKNGREISFTKLKVHSMEKHKLASIRETGDVVGIDVASLETYRVPLDLNQEYVNDFKFEITIKFEESD